MIYFKGFYTHKGDEKNGERISFLHIHSLTHTHTDTHTYTRTRDRKYFANVLQLQFLCYFVKI